MLPVTSPSLRLADAKQCHELLDYPGLVDGLREMFATGVDLLESFRMQQSLSEGRCNDWILLPAWQFNRFKGIKLVSVYPENEKQGLASVQGIYILFDANNGLPLLCADGAALTLRKTAANSALASTYLSRRDSTSLLMIGAGALAPYLIAAHAAVREIDRVRIWNRNPERGRQLARNLNLQGVSAEAIDNLEDAAREADVISCATMALQPLLKGEWLKPGTHVDLVGGYKPDMREADDETIKRARIFVDGPFALTLAGDICQPLQCGILQEADITSTFDLARGDRIGRKNYNEITVFKSVGGGHEDLGTAIYLLKKLESSNTSA